MSNPPPGGRGGRGLALLQQMRRPGAVPAAPAPAPPTPAAPTPAAPAPAAPAPLESAAAATPAPPDPSVSVPPVATPSAPVPAPVTARPAPPVGRGRGASALLAAKTATVAGAPSTAPAVAAAVAAPPRPQSPAQLPHAGRGVSEVSEPTPPGAIPKSAPAPTNVAPLGRGGGRGASGLALLQKKPGGSPASTTGTTASSSPMSSPLSSTPASTAAPSTALSTPPSTSAGSDSTAPPSTTGSGTTAPPSTTGSGTTAATTRTPSTTDSGATAATTRAPSSTSGSGTGGTSGSGAGGTSGSGTTSGADTLASSVSKIHLNKPRSDPVVKKGDSGKPCPMQTNYIGIKTATGSIYQYHVSFEPHVDARNVRFSLMNQNKETLGKVKAFDGVILYLPVKLPDPVTIMTGLRKTDNATITIKVQMTVMPSWEECPKVFNVIFGRVMKALKLVEVGRNKYDNKAAVSIPQHKLEVWPGYVTHITEQEGGVMLNCDASHRVLRCETCFEVMGFTFKQTKGGPTFKTECIKQLVGQVVLTRYNNNTYRVDDIDFSQTPKSTFPLRSGGEMSYLDYYKDHYGLTIKDHDQPLLIHRPRPRKRDVDDPPITEEEANRVIMLIPELTYLTGMSDAMRADFRVMKDIAVHTRITPDQRRSFLQKFIQRVKGCEEAKSELDGWGLQLDDDIMTVTGRTLPAENIMFGRGYKSSAGPTAEWSRDATTKTVLRAVNVTDWLVIFVKRDAQKGADFVDQMKKICPTIGIQIKDPTIITLNDDRTETFIKEMKANMKIGTTQLIVTIMPTQRDDRYNAIKKLCYVEQPVASQVVNSKTLDPKKLRSVCQKIALQINCKLGGELWAVDVPIKSLMIVGIDSYHEKTKKGSSVAGFVASINATISRYYSQTCSGSHANQEMVDKLQHCFTGALNKYHEINHSLPEKIIVYRDGVGDGQLDAVAGHEVQQFYSAFAGFQTDYRPKLSVVVVQKRINTKLFMKTAKGLDNPPPGTVMDHTVTKRDYYDFLLVSQHVRQGTVTPTHFVCVHDDLALPPNHMQRLAYKMTHMYYNWPGTVRVPAPCQYAHKLAYMTGQNICRTPHGDLCDKLFYL